MQRLQFDVGGPYVPVVDWSDKLESAVYKPNSNLHCYIGKLLSTFKWDTPENLGVTYLALATPPLEQFLGGRVPTDPVNMRAKFESQAAADQESRNFSV